MSNFLEKFTKENYKKFLEEEKRNEQEKLAKKNDAFEQKKTEVDTVKENKQQSENQELLDDDKQKIDAVKDTQPVITLKEDTEVSEDSVDIATNQDEEEVIIIRDDFDGTTRGNQEEVEIDTTFKKKKKKQRIILILIAVAVVVAFSLTWFFINRVKLPLLTGKNYAEATKWAKDNKITLEVSNKYSIEFDENIVMEQGKEADTAIMKGDKLTIVVSNGADPEESIKLPDFSGKDQKEIDEWIKKSKMKNVTVTQEYSKDIPKGIYIKTTMKDPKVTEDNLKRKDYVVISVSKGEEVFEKNIEVPKFKDKGKTDVEEWAKKNEIEIEFTEQASNTVADGMVISQSVQGGEKVAKHDTVGFIISTGKAVVVPNYYNYTAETAGSAGGISAEVTTVYSDSVAYGYLIYQSHPAGAVYTLSDDIKVKVVYSLGLPYIPNLLGMSESELPSKFFAFQSNGANISYDVVYTSSSCAKGMVVDASKYSQFTGLKDHVVVYVSDGAGSSCATNAADTRGGTDSSNK